MLDLIDLNKSKKIVGQYVEELTNGLEIKKQAQNKGKEVNYILREIHNIEESINNFNYKIISFITYFQKHHLSCDAQTISTMDDVKETTTFENSKFYNDSNNILIYPLFRDKRGTKILDLLGVNENYRDNYDKIRREVFEKWKYSSLQEGKDYDTIYDAYDGERMFTIRNYECNSKKQIGFYKRFLEHYFCSLIYKHPFNSDSLLEIYNDTINSNPVPIKWEELISK